jgi:hypothetical protein
MGVPRAKFAHKPLTGDTAQFAIHEVLNPPEEE